MRRTAVTLFIVGLTVVSFALHPHTQPTACAPTTMAEQLDRVDYAPKWIKFVEKDTLFDVAMPEEHQLFALDVCEEYDLDFTTFMSLVMVESEYRETVISKVNSNGTRDYGYTQLNSEYFFDFAKDARVPVESLESALSFRVSLRVGAFVLSRHLKYWRAQEGISEESIFSLTLTSYNKGRSWAIDNGVFEPYVSKVLKAKTILEKGGTYEVIRE